MQGNHLHPDEINANLNETQRGTYGDANDWTHRGFGPKHGDLTYSDHYQEGSKKQYEIWKYGHDAVAKQDRIVEIHWVLNSDGSWTGFKPVDPPKK